MAHRWKKIAEYCRIGVEKDEKWVVDYGYSGAKMEGFHYPSNVYLHPPIFSKVLFQVKITAFTPELVVILHTEWKSIKDRTNAHSLRDLKVLLSPLSPRNQSQLILQDDQRF